MFLKGLFYTPEFVNIILQVSFLPIVLIGNIMVNATFLESLSRLWPLKEAFGLYLSQGTYDSLYFKKVKCSCFRMNCSFSYFRALTHVTYSLFIVCDHKPSDFVSAISFMWQ